MMWIVPVILYTIVGYGFSYTKTAKNIDNVIYYHICVGPVSWIMSIFFWMWYVSMILRDDSE